MYEQDNADALSKTMSADEVRVLHASNERSPLCNSVPTGQLAYVIQGSSPYREVVDHSEDRESDHVNSSEKVFGKGVGRPLHALGKFFGTEPAMDADAKGADSELDSGAAQYL